MSAALDVFRSDYAAALRHYLRSGSEAGLTVGHELGRRALVEGISILDITEDHFRVTASERLDNREMALQFLLQTLTALDVATRGFLSGAARYEQQRARADDLARRDAFRQGLVDALQEGFFVADDRGSVVEVNTAFGDITGYGADGVPYAWPYPWTPVDSPTDIGTTEMARQWAVSGGRFVLPIQHRDGRQVWLAVTANQVPAEDGRDGMLHVGTIRDITGERIATAREQTAARLATTLSAATTVAEVFAAGLGEGCAAIDAASAVAAVWGGNDEEPTLYTVGTLVGSWNELAPDARRALTECRHRSGAAVRPTAGHGDEHASGLAVALGNGIDGAFWLAYRQPRRTTTDDTAVVTALAAQLGVTLHRAGSYDQARTTSLTLQRAMLSADSDLPSRFAVRYEPAVPPLEIGGDWYDVMPLPDDAIGIIVGDCVGSGLSAAAVMGQLRSSARALLSTGVGPGRMLDQLDVACAGIPGARCTTVLAVVVDPRRAVATYSSAGHVPAVLAAPDEPVRVLDNEARSLPLATFECAPRPEAELALPTAATLVLFTDGLVERRRSPIDDGIDAVAKLLIDAHADTPDGVADLVVNARRPAGGYDDDVAMVVYRSPPRPLQLEIRADPHELVSVRRRLSGWLTTAGVDAITAGDIVMATNEAVTNSIEHGYHDCADGVVSLTATLEDSLGRDALTITVADNGSWAGGESPAPIARDGYRGRGIEMMRALVDSVTFEHGDVGTVVQMRTELARHN